MIVIKPSATIVAHILYPSPSPSRGFHLLYRAVLLFHPLVYLRPSLALVFSHKPLLYIILNVSQELLYYTRLFDQSTLTF